MGGRDGGEGAAGADERRQAQDEETGEFYPEIRTYVVKGFENALFLVQLAKKSVRIQYNPGSACPSVSRPIDVLTDLSYYAMV